MEQAFHPLEEMKNHFAFKNHINYDIENRIGKVIMDLYRPLDGSDHAQSVTLLKIGEKTPSLPDADRETP